MGSTEEPERKRRALSTASPPLKKPQPMPPVTEEKKLDAGMLQYQNQKLCQQLEVQKAEINDYKEKISQLQARQASFDDALSAVNRCWSELFDDLELLTVRAEPGNCESLCVLKSRSEPLCNDSAGTSGPPEEAFLQRLVQSSGGDGNLDGAIASRKVATVKTMKYLVQTIDLQRSKNEELSAILKTHLSADEASEGLRKVNEDLRAEIKDLRNAMDSLHLKHKTMSSEITSLEDCRTKSRAEIARLTGELEEASSQLEISRRKLTALRNQKDAPIGPSTPVPLSSRDGDKKLMREIRELEYSLEEAKTLAAQRLNELHEAHQAKMELTGQLQRLQDSHIEEQKITSSRPYVQLQDQVKFLRIEIDRCQFTMDRLQAERDNAYRHEKEISLKAEAGESARRALAMAETRINELEARLQQCMADRDELQLRLEEVTQLSGRKDTVSELKLMISTLHKEMGMMQTQLNKSKEACHEVCMLRAEVRSLTSVLERKETENKALSKRATDQSIETVVLKEKIKKLTETEQEMKLIMDMYEKESTEPCDVMQLQQSECRARAQIQRLKEALDEHSLELRVKAANEAEAVCQQRLAAAEAEIVDLRQRLDACTRKEMELIETIKAKNEEGDAYIAEIETIGQAYEDMQTQNHRLLQQISARDDDNTKLVSEGLKAKQLHASLVSEKQLIQARMQQATMAADSQRQRVGRLEDQIRSYFDQLGKAADENRQCASALEVAKRKMAEAERESLSLRSSLDAAAKELQEKGGRAVQALAELEKERFEKRRLQEELSVWHNKASRFHSQEGGSMVERLQTEIDDYRTLLKCNVCGDRQKQVVISKCYHLFCEPCIQQNLQTRHRKCPACGVTFGRTDVHHVYI